MARNPRIETIVQPSVRVSTQWTPALIRSAFNQAESGHIRLLAELCDNILADDRVETVFDTRIGGLLGLPLTFEESGDGRRKKRAVRALEAEDDWWAAFPEHELTQFLIWGRLLGASFAQLHPTEHRGRVIPRIEPWHPKNTRFDWPTRRWMAKVDGTGFEQPIEPGNGQWLIYTPYGSYRPWAHGLWRGLSRWWLLKSFAQDDSGRRSEKSGTTVVTSEDGSGSTRDLRLQLASDIADAGRESVISLPPGFDAKMLATAESIKDNQGVLVDMANSAIAIAVLGQNLTTEVKQGTYAAAKVHNKVEIQRIRSDAETASTTLHDQALEWWAEFNFGDRKLAPWPAWQTDPPTDQKERAEVLNTLSDALGKFAKLGLEPDMEQIQTEFSIKLTKVAPPKPEATESADGDTQDVENQGEEPATLPN